MKKYWVYLRSHRYRFVEAESLTAAIESVGNDYYGFAIQADMYHPRPEERE